MMTRFINRHRRGAQLLAYILIAAAAIFASARTFDLAKSNTEALQQISREGVERRDQSCRGDEAEHVQEVTRLTRTYEYVDSLPTKSFNDLDTINKAIIRQIPDIEADAKTDPAPEFCDKTVINPETGERENVGLPEPDPIIPERPESVQRLLEEAELASEEAKDAKANEAVGDVRGK
jgi:hypothetical protein